MDRQRLSLRRRSSVLVLPVLFALAACSSTGATPDASASDAGAIDAGAADAGLPDASAAVDAGCTSPLTQCGGACVDLQSDPAHCGSCSRPCCIGASCSAGQCVAGGCSAGEVICQVPSDAGCEEACTNLQTDSSHCGSCSLACCPGSACNVGQCAVGCPSGETACPFTYDAGCGGGICVDTQTDSANCGGCDKPCDSGICTGGVCT